MVKDAANENEARTTALSVESVALAAFRKREAEQKARWNAEHERRMRESEELDAQRMADVVMRSPLTEWFPGVQWVLVDRKFQSETAVVHPSGSPDLFLMVTRVTIAEVEPPRFMVRIAVRAAFPSVTPWREGQRINDPADLGEHLDRLSRPQESASA